MLDPEHPRYPIYMKARSLVGRIIENAKAMTLLRTTSERQALSKRCDEVLADMAEFNAQFFGSRLYAIGIEEIQQSLVRLAGEVLNPSCSDEQCSACGAKFIKLSSLGTQELYCDDCVTPVFSGIQKLRRVVEYGES